MARRLSDKLMFVSSLFYFRIPQDEWQDRIDKVRGAGYDGIDLYIPWNFHERTAGHFEFTGNADVGRFLDMVGASGLTAIARPGPYICSEWDGGGLPAWLYPRQGLRLRQVDPSFLAAVEVWFAAIVSILRSRQVGHGGPIIGVQVENELDFYPTDQPKQYIEALATMLRTDGIVVPITACLGNGDYLRATGGSDAVIPMVNIYPHERPNADYDRVLESYVSFARRHDVDPMIMETSRDTTFLARLASVGFRVISPYLMASGVNMDSWNGVNNWGDTPTFVTTDLDFGGMIAADGGLREDFFAQRVLRMTLRSMDNLVSRATPVGSGTSETPYRPIATVPEDLPLHWRSLRSPQGTLHFAFNFGSQVVSGSVVVEGQPITIRVPAESYEILLDRWQPPGSAVRVSAVGSIVQAEEVDDILYLVISANSDQSWVQVAVAEVGEDSTEGQVLGTARVDNSGLPMRVALTDGRDLVVVGLDRPSAGRVWPLGALGSLMGPTLLRDWYVNEQGELSLCADWTTSQGRLVSIQGKETLIAVPSAGPDQQRRGPVAVTWFFQRRFRFGLGDLPQTEDVPRTMEALGMLHGRAVYETVLPEGEVALRINGAADIVWAYVNGQFLSSHSPAGEAFVIQLSQWSRTVVHLMLVTEIWGHSNFNDPTRQSTRLGSQRGLTGSVVRLPEGTVVSGWTMAPANFEADDAEGRVDQPTLPMHYTAGSIYILTGRFTVGPGPRLGLHVRVKARNARIDVRVNGIKVGRLWFGPALSPRLVGGKTDVLWIRPDVLNQGEEQGLELEVVTTADGTLDGLEWIWSPSHPEISNQHMRICLDRTGCSHSTVRKD